MVQAFQGHLGKTGNPTILFIGQKWLNQRENCTEVQQEILRSKKPPRADYREMSVDNNDMWMHASLLNLLEPSWGHLSGQLDGQESAFYTDVHICLAVKIQRGNCFEA